MKLIDRIDIENWAGTYEAKGNFPYLISKLIYFSTPVGAQINIPSGSAVFIGGWDGTVDSEDEREYVPKGKSLWEFGTNADFKTKADKDFAKRTENPLGYDPLKCTYVFVTPRIWTGKDIWRQDKINDGKWKDVRVYDSIDLEQWLDISRPVATWFSCELGKLPFDGVLGADQFWIEWSEGPKGTLMPQVVTSGRESEMDKLYSFLIGLPGIKAVKAKTKTEAIAFIIASAKQFTSEHSNRFFSKTLLVETDGSYRALYTNSKKSTLNLIPKFEDTTPLYAAVSKGHHVIVPLGGDDSFNQDIITLPTITKEGQIEGLIQMGLTREDADRYSKEAARDITILRKLLKFPHNKSAWLKNENVRDIVPALLLGRWNSNNSGDREILEKLSNTPYNDYIKILARWKDFEESPILQIGDTWRLTSPLDLWASLSIFLDENDFKLLSEIFLQVYQDIENNEENNEDTSGIIHFFSKPKKYSNWCKEGLAQSLILISQYGGGLQIAKLQNPQLWVDQLVNMLLHNADESLWIALNQKLPLISEASPISFLKAVKHSLEMDKPPIMEMFATKPAGILGDSSNHTGLLWALEGLAWLPEYLYDATLILLRLSSLDPGGNLANRPANSLVEIFKPWHFQTLTKFEERMEILSQSVRKEKEEGWNLLLKLLPQTHGTASQTHKMRWRMFDKNINLNYTYEEVYLTYSTVVDFALELFDYTDEKLAQLLEHSTTMSSAQDSEKMLSFIEAVYPKIPKNSTLTRDKIRKILSHHRSYPDATWSLSENILIRYQNLYDSIEPEDVVLKHKWLFDNFYIDFPDGKYRIEDSEDHYQKHFKRVEKARTEALKNIIDSIGIHKTIELADSNESSESIGETLGKILSTEEESFVILDTLKKEKPNLNLIHRFIVSKVIADGLNWAFQIFYKMQIAGFTDEQLAQLFIPLYPSKKLWDFIEGTNKNIKEKYWLFAHSRLYHIPTEEKILGLNYLLQYKRFITAINTAYMVKKEIPTDLLVKILEMTATEESSEKYDLREYEVSSLFKTIEKREDLDHNKLIKLEWMYLKVLASYGSGYKPKRLQQELSKNPVFFTDVLKWVYMPKDDKLKEEERKGISEEALRNYAEQGYRLLNEFKTIPGTKDDDKTINREELNLWVDAVRDEATKSDRLEIADMQIGKLLAQYSEENKDYWPPDEISEVIERINTKNLKDNFSVGVTNKRGFTSRGPFDGGNIERFNAVHFQKLAELHKLKHPNLSEIFSQISARYLYHAKHEDEQAERDRLEY